MKIAICDDEKEYRKIIADYVNTYFNDKSNDFKCSEFDSGEALLSSNQNFDILFLDIELGDSNGIEIAKEIQKKYANTIILIVTSYRQYLDAAMDLKVTRYIDKPITRNRIFSALDKASSEINETVIVLHMKDNRIARIKQSDIVFAEAKLKGVTIYCNNEYYRIKETMKQLRSMLTSSCFAIPHNSYIVNLNYVKNFKRDEIYLTDPYASQRISIATRKQPDFKRKFLDFIGEECIND